MEESFIQFVKGPRPQTYDQIKPNVVYESMILTMVLDFPQLNKTVFCSMYNYRLAGQDKLICEYTITKAKGCFFVVFFFTLLFYLLFTTLATWSKMATLAPTISVSQQIKKQKQKNLRWLNSFLLKFLPGSFMSNFAYTPLARTQSCDDHRVWNVLSLVQVTHTPLLFENLNITEEKGNRSIPYQNI